MYQKIDCSSSYEEMFTIFLSTNNFTQWPEKECVDVLELSALLNSDSSTLLHPLERRWVMMLGTGSNLMVSPSLESVVMFLVDSLA